ncbi:hypothetical protein NM688_g8796 [Phlebia brevispora]|uniref:Uncharacterized protein n=1 Tax=Phlebia brevispora TaxID=194682 RepID=A0ACC1RMV4_9APHY|nr:hypothetical protein NM688_g8796 [Phlebia brevispora]
MVAISKLVSGLFTAAASYTISEHIAAFQGLTRCNISTNVGQLNLTPINNSLTPPTNTTPAFVGLAFGVQNYTCTQSNNFTNVGAVAELFDISCLVNSTIFETIQLPLFAAWDTFEGISIQDFIEFFHEVNPPEVLAQHYFVTNPVTGQGVSPKWDFTSSGNPKFFGNSNAFIIGKTKATVPAPNAAVNVNWLDVVNVGGDVGGEIADEVFRVDTVGGQPPSSCVFGQTQDISVKYTSKYWFFGGELGGPGTPEPF